MLKKIAYHAQNLRNAKWDWGWEDWPEKYRCHIGHFYHNGVHYYGLHLYKFYINAVT